MNLTPSRRAFLLALCSAAAACGSAPSEGDTARSSDALGVIKLAPQPASQSFLPPASWSQAFTSSTGWNPSKNVRLLADVDHDGKQDMVGFGDAGVYLAHSTGVAFEPAQFVVADFGVANGWSVDNHVRTMADINGDGRADIVGFGNDGVWTSLSTGASFAAPKYALADFGYDQGWRVATHVRLMADVNGDGLQDIVAFGNAGVYLSLASATGFGPSTFVIANFGADQGWDPALHVRTTGDIDGDGRQDIVAFGYDGVWTALSTGTGFAAPQLVLAAFGDSAAAGGWTAGGRHERRVVDIDGDHKADIVGFGESGTYIARATGAGGFGAVTLAIADFGFTQIGYTVPGLSERFIGDFNGDGYQDIVCNLAAESLRRSIGAANATFGAPATVLTELTNIGGMLVNGDVDGDGLQDIVGFAVTDVEVERGSASPVPPPPVAPSNARITGVSPTSISLAWNDNSSNEVAFGISYKDMTNNSPGFTDTAPNVTSVNVTALISNTTYCFTVEAAGYFGNSFAPQVCGKTLLHGPTIALVASTHTSLGLSVTAPGATALRWDLDGPSTSGTTQNGASASPVFTGLAAGSTHCLHAAQEVASTWSVDSVACFTTPQLQTGTTTLAMAEDPPPYTGFISYSGTWTPQGRAIKSFTSAYPAGEGIAFVKPGFDPASDCGTNGAVIVLEGNATLSASQVAQIAWAQADGSSVFVGCPIGTSSAIPNLLFTNVNWTE